VSSVKWYPSPFSDPLTLILILSLSFSHSYPLTFILILIFLKVLRTLVKLYTELSIPDYISICRCLVFLDDAPAVANILKKLLENPQNQDDTLLAFQIAFELCDNATQQFLHNVIKTLPQITTEEPLKQDPKTDSMEIEKVHFHSTLHRVHIYTFTHLFLWLCFLLVLNIV
jgi:hypothetical protein